MGEDAAPLESRKRHVRDSTIEGVLGVPGARAFEPTEEPNLDPSLWMRISKSDSELDKLGAFFGFDVRRSNGRVCVTTQEHRAVVAAAWAARQDKLFTSPPFLFRLDAHEDADADFDDVCDEQSKRITNIEDAVLFANAMNRNDSGWLDAVLQLGWVGDTACAYLQYSSDQESDVTDVHGKDHWTMSFAGLAARLNKAVTTSDRKRSPTDRILNRIYEVAQEGIRPVADPEKRERPTPLWVDIDLDFATMDVKTRPIRPWPLDRFRNELAIPIVKDAGLLVGEFIHGLLNSAQLITIATEPSFCGGLAGASSILASLRSTLHEHSCFHDLDD